MVGGFGGPPMIELGSVHDMLRLVERLQIERQRNRRLVVDPHLHFVRHVGSRSRVGLQVSGLVWVVHEWLGLHVRRQHRSARCGIVGLRSGCRVGSCGLGLGLEVRKVSVRSGDRIEPLPRSCRVSCLSENRCRQSCHATRLAVATNSATKAATRLKH